MTKRFAGAFFLSGVAALCYELIWFRLLGHIFGSTATATATLLAAYLFGLGIGAWIFGRLSDRIGRLALLYVAVEAAIGLYGLGSHALLERGAALYAVGHAWAGGDAARLLVARFAVSFVLIAIPTTLMGGTFPLMVHLLRSRAVDVGRATGRAYAINTAGAALGSLALPAVFLPGLGATLSLVAAALANFAAALLVFFQARRPLPAGAEPAAPEPAAPEPRRDARASKAAGAGGPRAALRSSPLLAGFFFSSFAALALETVWARHFGIFFGPQIYTFAFILFAYLVGLFLGGAAFARWSARGVAPAALLRAGFVISAVSVTATLPFLDYLPMPQVRLMTALGVSHGTFLVTSALETLVLVLPPAVGFGLVFPAVVALLAGGGRPAGASVAVTYVVNTLGTTLGAIGAGFWLVPAIGSQRTLEISILLVAAALALAPRPAAGRAPAAGRQASFWRRPAAAYGLPAVFLLVLVLPRWDWRLAHASYAKDPLKFVQNMENGSLAISLPAYHIPYFEEGTEATVSVLEVEGFESRALFINGKPDASDGADDMVVQRLSAIVPALFHPDPQRALVIGLGSGTTVGSLARFPLAAIDAAEISPGVNRIAQRYFANVNDRFWEDPRVAMRLDDGRNYLHFQPPASYDLIISEPSNPWMTGPSALFTDEFFTEAKERLRPGGILCQWFHYYNMSLPHIRLLMRTFIRHFPETAVLVMRGASPTGDLLLIGSKGPLRLQRYPEDPSLPAGVRAALAEVQNGSTFDLLNGLVLGPADLAAFAGSGALNTDDRPVLELQAPADRFVPAFFPNLRSLLTATGRSFLAAGPPPEALDAGSALAAAGFDVSRGLPEGREVRRGATVLTLARSDAGDIARWVLLGSEFESEGTEGTAGAVTGLFWLARPPQGPAEIRDISGCLARPRLLEEGTFPVSGHPGLWTYGESDSTRNLVCTWFCPAQGLAYFLTRQVPLTSPLAAEAIAADLAARFPCAHGGR